MAVQYHREREKLIEITEEKHQQQVEMQELIDKKEMENKNMTAETHRLRQTILDKESEKQQMFKGN